MGLDQAIYNSTVGKIIGIRGPMIHVYNATSGALENSYFTLAAAKGVSGVCSVGSMLYIATFNSQYQNHKTQWLLQTNAPSDVWRIDYTALGGSPTCCDLFVQVADIMGTCAVDGMAPIISNGSIVVSQMHNATDTHLLAFDGSGPPYTYQEDTWNSLELINSDMGFDNTGNNLIVTSPPYYRIDVCDTSSIAGFYKSDSSDGKAGEPFWSGGVIPIGVCWCTSNSQIYCVTGTATVYRMPINFSAFNSIATGVVGAGPIRVKYSSTADKIYVPNWAVNSVTVIDPATDACTVKTGFDHPWDIVVAGAKVFAVQDGTPTLKEVV